MPVGSTFELYTSVLGWFLYDALWGIFLNTGLFLIPFAAAVIGTLLDARNSPIRVDAKDLVRALEGKIYVMIGVLLFAVNPMLNVYPAATTYTDYRCGVDVSGDMERNTIERAFGDTDTTHDTAEGGWIAMLDDTIPRAPVWWFVTTRLNHGVAQASKQSLPCQTDLRLMTAGLSHLNLTDQILKEEVKDFYRDCWMPAANKYMRDRPTEDEIPNVLRDRIADDISWAGSEFFMDKPGYYDTFRPSKALNPDYFPYMELRDSVITGPDYSEGGFPPCNDWWETDEDGLRDRLADSLRDGEMSRDCEDCTGAWYWYWAESVFANETDAENALIRTALTSDVNKLKMNMTSVKESSGYFDQFARYAKGLGVTLGLTKGGIPDSLKTEGIRQVAPLIQAIVLLVFTMALPVLMTLGSYNLGSLIALTLVQFSIIFWSFLFSLAEWLDNFLMSGLLSVSDRGSLLVAFVKGGSELEESALDRVAINWVVNACYLLVPLAFSWFVGVVGVRAGNAIAQGMNNPASSIGGAASKVPMPGPGALGKVLK